MVAQFDCKNWPVRSYDLTDAPTTSTAGRGVGGFKQVVRAQNNYWRGTFTLNPLRKLIMCDFQGWLGSLQGSYHPFDMCICDPCSAKSMQTHAELLTDLGYDVTKLCGPVAGLYGLPFSDGTCFADGRGFDGLPLPPEILVAADAGAGHTQVQLTGAERVKRGTYFSTTENFLYKVTAVDGDQFTFTPPLRRPLTTGEVLETRHPKIRVRLSSDTSGVPTINYGRSTSEIVLAVEEVLDR